MGIFGADDTARREAMKMNQRIAFQQNQMADEMRRE